MKEELIKFKEIVLSILFLIPLLVLSQDNLKYSNSITITDLEKHISVLSSDSLEGR